MRKIVLGFATFAAIAIAAPIAGTVATTLTSSEAAAQVTVRVGDGHSRYESRMRRHHRECRTVETRRRGPGGRVVITKRRVCG